MGRFEHLEMGDWRPEHIDVDPNYSGVIDQYYYLERADQAFADEDYEKALALYSRCLQYEISIEQGWLGQLRCLIELGELPEAVVWSNRALERFPKSSSILAARAVAETRMGNSGSAIGYSDSALSSQGLCPYTWIARGEVLISVNANNAKACFSKAVEMAPNDGTLHACIARSYIVRRCYHQALEHLKHAVRLDPDRFTCWYWTGKCQEQMGNINEARIAYRRALAARPSFVKAQNALRELEQRGTVSKTISALKRLFGGGKTSEV